MSLNNKGTVCEDPNEQSLIRMHELYGPDPHFLDDISWSPLDPKLVAAARAEEIRGGSKT